MAIRVKKISNNKIGVLQIPSQPLVYVDNWAYNWFYNNRSFAEEFKTVLREKKGTLAVSLINTLEIARKEDDEQVMFVLDFIDQVDSVFIDLNLQRVLDEERFYKEKGFFGITLDSCLEFCFPKYFQIESEEFRDFKLSEFIKRLNDCLKRGHIIVEDFEEELMPLVQTTRMNKYALAKVKSHYSNRKKTNRKNMPCTEDIFRLIMEFVTINETMKMGNKEWRDVCHVVIPVSYCDFVLIDKRWAKFIEDTGLKFPQIAKVYYQKEMNSFISDLKKFNLSV